MAKKTAGTFEKRQAGAMVHAPELALCDSHPGCVGDVFVVVF